MMKTLKGSKKQVQWATELRDTALKILNETLPELEREKNLLAIKKCHTLIERISNEESAEHIIGVFYHLEYTDNRLLNIKNLMSKIKMSVTPLKEGLFN